MQLNSHSPTVRSVRRSRGFFSLELSLVLLVAAVAIIAAVLVYLENVRQNSINSNVQYLQMIAGNAKSTYGVRNEYGSVTTAVAVQGRLIPTSLRDGTAATASNPFGASITVTPANATGTTDVLDVVWGNVPSDQCAGIVNGTQGVMRAITVGTAAVKPLDSPQNIALTTTACESAANVSITFRIGRS